MKNFNKKNLKKKNAGQPYKLEANDPYSGDRNVVAYGSRDDLEVIKSMTKPELKPVIVKKKPCLTNHRECSIIKVW